MKKKSIISFVLFALFYLTVNFSQAQTVYVTETGKKFHMKNCTNAKTGKTGMEYSEAKKKGYTACGICKPDEKKLGVVADDPKKISK